MCLRNDILKSIRNTKKEANMSSNKYIPPESVISPKAHWSLISVLLDEGPTNIAIAVGNWDREPVLAMRWNGSDENPLGNPQSRGLATWFVLPNGRFAEAILNTLPDNKQALVRAFFPKLTQ